jgi:hypothetical protein
MRGCLLGLLLGCGFHGIENLSAPDLASGADLAGVDFAGADLRQVATGMDLAGGDLTMVATGPGPLGALPSGYCCTSDEECRSRVCITSTSPSYCSDECRSDGICNVWGPGFACDLPSGRCMPTATPYSCHPADQYQHGDKPLGSCCVHGIPSAGQECLGGLCVTTGADGNPFYCTQGCDGTTPCPGGYDCFVGFCWISQTVSDPTYLYMCQ